MSSEYAYTSYFLKNDRHADFFSQNNNIIVKDSKIHILANEICLLEAK